jgi:CheY-like chemotaxis protein
MIGKVVNILLVEDDSLDIMNVERTLKRIDVNHKLYIARNGQEAWDMLHGNGVEKISPPPSVIMLDINMPKMNGLEFLSLLRKDEELKDIKVFIMTTSNDTSDRKFSKELGISGYIIKPLNFNNPASSIDSFSLMIDLLNFKKN